MGPSSFLPGIRSTSDSLCLQLGTADNAWYTPVTLCSTQDEPAFCGLASLAMVLNALSIDPRRTWKGSWRWFHEAMLDCCRWERVGWLGKATWRAVVPRKASDAVVTDKA